MYPYLAFLWRNSISCVFFFQEDPLLWNYVHASVSAWSSHIDETDVHPQVRASRIVDLHYTCLHAQWSFAKTGHTEAVSVGYIVSQETVWILFP